MIEGDPQNLRRLAALLDPGCLEFEKMPAVFLRLHSPQEQIALPYASLLKLSLKTDETALELSFVSHRVTIIGKNLLEIYKSVAAAEARMIGVAPREFAAEAALPSCRALVRGIRIEPLDPEERRKR